jgi:diacylglycerol kinase (ATP)
MRNRINSFKHAIRGGWTLFSTQTHAKFHTLTTLAVLIAGMILKVSISEWTLLIIAISMVWMAEAFNTAIEFLADEVTLEFSERIKKAKDVAAFAVLVSAISASIIGILVFWPYLKIYF